jgi:TonB family protein
MTRSEQKDLERLGIAAAVGLILHLVLGLVLTTVEWAPRREVYPKTILVDLSDPVSAPVEKRSEPEPPAPSPEPAESVREAESPPRSQPEPPAQTPAAAEQQAPVRAAPAQAAANPVRPRPEPQPVTRPQPVQTTPKTAATAPTPTPSVSSAPVEGPSTRYAVDPSQEIPVQQRPPTDLGTRQVAEVPSLPKPQVEVPDWAREAGAAAPSPSDARDSGTDTPARTGSEPREAASSLNFEQLDRALAQTGSTSSRPQSGQPERQVLAPPAPASGTGSRTDLSWNDPERGREVTKQVRPELPGWVEEQGFRGDVQVSLEVTAGGTVGRVTIVKTSGYTDVDNAVLEAVRRWGFTPASSGGTAYGMLTLYIRPET